ncbi:hypothetical protein EDC94DRAFT_660427 [Helicostylum pulchrum]|nr:hypothetical protein EDC94DRAFT_660427 [Helicostylum pulchrum]
MEGGYTYDIQEVAEEDYRYSADEASNNCDKAFSYWAKNIRNNNHSPLLMMAREFWMNERKARKLNGAILQNDIPRPPMPRDRKYIGTIIKDDAKTTTIIDYKTNYFKTQEDEMLIVHFTDEGWFVVEKITGIDTPNPYR